MSLLLHEKNEEFTRFYQRGVITVAHHPITDTNDSANETFDEVLKRGLANPSRRLLIKGGAGLASVMTLPMLGACASSAGASPALKSLSSSTLLGFSPTA